MAERTGIAARFLYPKPRDFTSAEFRLVTTTNLVPTEDDLFQVITRGMPGSAMFPAVVPPPAMQSPRPFFPIEPTVGAPRYSAWAFGSYAAGPAQAGPLRSL